MGSTATLVVASSWWDRARGFLKARPEGCVLLIAPCQSIHTFGMRSALDVAFLGGKGEVLLSRRQVLPGRLVSCRGAKAVLERVFDAQAKWYDEGEKVMLYVQANDCS